MIETTETTEMAASLWDILIVGAGPGGLSAAINGLARGKKVCVLSNASNYLAKAEQVNNYLGFHQVTGQSMMQSFLDHAKALGLIPQIGKVANILPMGHQFVVNFGGDLWRSKTVILATGVAKTKPIPGEEALLGRGVSYCATCDGMLYRNQAVVVCGSADNAGEEANFLQSLGAQVTFVAPGRPPEDLALGVTFRQGTVTSILGEQQVTKVLISHQSTQWELPTKGVFVLRNAIAPTALVADLATDQGFIKVNPWQETNIPGLYACGDCAGPPLQIAKAVGQGLVAAQQAAKYREA